MIHLKKQLIKLILQNSCIFLVFLCQQNGNSQINNRIIIEKNIQLNKENFKFYTPSSNYLYNKHDTIFFIDKGIFGDNLKFKIDTFNVVGISMRDIKSKILKKGEKNGRIFMAIENIDFSVADKIRVKLRNSYIYRYKKRPSSMEISSFTLSFYFDCNEHRWFYEGLFH